MAGKPGKGSISPRDKVVALKAVQQMDLPQAPTELPMEAAREWNDIVVTYPADRFPRSTWPMLAAYCRHAMERRRIGRDIDELVKDPEYSRREYRDQLRAMTDQTKALASLGVRLGIARTSMAGRHNNDPDTVAEFNLPWEA